MCLRKFVGFFSIVFSVAFCFWFSHLYLWYVGATYVFGIGYLYLIIINQATCFFKRKSDPLQKLKISYLKVNKKTPKCSTYHPHTFFEDLAQWELSFSAAFFFQGPLARILIKVNFAANTCSMENPLRTSKFLIHS